MCGRYARRGDKQRIADAFHVKEVPGFAMPDADYNIAPTTFQPIIRESKETGEREMVLARWGLIPFFTKELSDIKGLSTINAKAEKTAWVKSFMAGVVAVFGGIGELRSAPGELRRNHTRKSL